MQRLERTMRTKTWRRDLAGSVVAFSLVAGCSSNPPQHLGMTGQTVAQQEKDSEECKTAIKQEQGGMMGGNMSTGWGAFWAGGMGAVKAKEAQEAYAKCMTDRGYKVVAE